MSELRSAKEWVADLRKRKRPPGNVNLVGWVTEGEIAEVQRNVLEAALSVVRQIPHHASRRRCAHALRDLIPKDPAPADEVKP